MSPRGSRDLDGVIDSDVVIVGAGVAGLSAALGMRGRRVTVLSKMPFSAGAAGGSSVWAQGGIAAAVGEDDSPRLHARDTLAAGAGLSVPEVVAILTEEGPGRVLELIDRGARFDRDPSGELSLGREAAHCRRRVLHANGDATGAEVVRALLAALPAAPWVETVGGVEALDLALGLEGSRTAGVVALTSGGSRVLYRAPAVVLACGGLGQVFLSTTNPPENTGDGIAIAARAGARLVDLEMVQFHPTALAVGADPMPLLTEALRGEGAILVDGEGHRFMVAEHELAELAPRDVVARAIWRKLASGAEVYLDARAAVGESFPERFPTVFALCRKHGLDPRREAMPVSPAAHFHMGGVATDALGRTSRAGLWACGEVASSGVHGANRLASNSLLEGLVYGARVAVDISDSRVADFRPSEARLTWAGGRGASRSSLSLPEERSREAEIRRIMWTDVGLARDAEGLRRALTQLRRLSWWTLSASPRLRNLHTVAMAVAAAALGRRESRGAHFRSDFPAADPAWRRRLFFTYSAGRLDPAEAWPGPAHPAQAPAAEVRA